MLPEVKEFDLLTRGLMDWKFRLELGRQGFQKEKDDLQKSSEQLVNSLEQEFNVRSSILRKLRLLENVLHRQRQRFSSFLSSKADGGERIRQMVRVRINSTDNLLSTFDPIFNEAMIHLDTLFTTSESLSSLLEDRTGATMPSRVTGEEQPWELLLPLKPLQDTTLEIEADNRQLSLLPFDSVRQWAPLLPVAVPEDDAARQKDRRTDAAETVEDVLSRPVHRFGRDRRDRSRPFTRWVEAVEAQWRLLQESGTLPELLEAHAAREAAGSLTPEEVLFGSYFSALNSLGQQLTDAVVYGNLALFAKPEAYTCRRTLSEEAVKQPPFNNMTEEQAKKCWAIWGLVPRTGRELVDSEAAAVGGMLSEQSKQKEGDVSFPWGADVKTLVQLAAEKRQEGLQWPQPGVTGLSLLVPAGETPLWQAMGYVRDALTAVRCVQLAATHTLIFSGGDDWALHVTDLRSHLPVLTDSLDLPLVSSVTALMGENKASENVDLTSLSLMGHTGPILSICEDSGTVHDSEVSASQIRDYGGRLEDHGLDAEELLRPGVVFTGSADTTIRAWRVQPRGVIGEGHKTTRAAHAASHAAVFKGHKEPVWSLDVHESLCLLLSGGGDGTVRLWSSAMPSVKQGGPVDSEIIEHSLGLFAVEEGRDILDSAEAASYSNPSWGVASAKFLPCEARCFVSAVASQAVVQLWDLESRTRVSQSETCASLYSEEGDQQAPGSAAITCLDVHNALPLACTGHANGIINLWDARALRRPVSRLGGLANDSPIGGVAFDCEGFFVGATSYDGHLHYLDVRTGRRIQHTRVCHTKGGEGALGISHGSGLIVVGGADGEMCLLESEHRPPPPKWMNVFETAIERDIIEKAGLHNHELARVKGA